MLWIKKLTLFLIFLLSADSLLFSQDQLRVLPLGNSITRGSMCTNGDVNTCQGIPDSEAIGYRSRLYNLMVGAGFDVDFVGNYKFGYATMSDPDNGGFPGIRDNYLADIMVSGSSSYTGRITTGPYLNTYPADVILLHIGTNDVSALDYTVNEVGRILDAIDDYETSSGQTILVFLAEIISRRNKPCGTDAGVVTFNNSLVSMAQSRINNGDHIVLVDMECDAGLDYYNDMMDQVHPNQTGYDKMADEWFSVINGYNTPPQVTQIPNQSADRGTGFSTISLDLYVYDAEDSDADMNWSVYPSSPEHFNVTIDPNRKATITPKDPNWSGSETIEFVATDNGKVITALKRSGSCLTQFTVNWMPEILGQQTISIPENSPRVIGVDDLIIVEPEKAPAGLQVVVSNGDNYTVQGQTITPAQNFTGTLSVPVRLVNGSDQSNLFTLTVQVTNVNHAPVITSDPVLTAKSGLEYVYNMTASDEDEGDVMIYSAVEKPTWITVNSSSGRVSGTPSLGDLGPVSITLKVSDGMEEDTQTYTLEVQNYNLPPDIITIPRDTALVDQTYTYGIQATDVENDPLTYFAKTLPGWLSFYDETQVLIGVPDGSYAGENLVVLGVSDTKDTTYQAFVIHVTFVAGEEQLTTELVHLFPNPATDRLIIDMRGYQGNPVHTLFEVIDLTGKKVLEEECFDATAEITLQGRGLQDGIYFFRLTDRSLKKVIKSGKLLIKTSGE